MFSDSALARPRYLYRVSEFQGQTVHEWGPAEGPVTAVAVYLLSTFQEMPLGARCENGPLDPCVRPGEGHYVAGRHGPKKQEEVQHSSTGLDRQADSGACEEPLGSTDSAHRV